MTLEEIRGLATDDLKKAAGDAREEMFKKRFQTALEAVDNTKTVRELRKQVARIKTVLRERDCCGSFLAALRDGARVISNPNQVRMAEQHSTHQSVCSRSTSVTAPQRNTEIAECALAFPPTIEPSSGPSS